MIKKNLQRSLIFKIKAEYLIMKMILFKHFNVLNYYNIDLIINCEYN